MLKNRNPRNVKPREATPSQKGHPGRLAAPSGQQRMPCFLGRPARWRSCVSGRVSPDEPDGARAPRQPSARRSASDGRESGDSVSDGQFRKHRWLPSPTERATDPTEPPACGAAAAAGPSTCTCPPALSGPRVQPPGGAIGPWPGAPPPSARAEPAACSALRTSGGHVPRRGTGWDCSRALPPA